MSDWMAALAGKDIATQAAVPAWITPANEPATFINALPFRIFQVPAVPRSVQFPASASADQPALSYQDGEAAGRASALAEFERELASQRALRLAFRQLDEAAMEMLASDLAQTVMALCDEVLGDFAADQNALLARCRAAAERMGGVTATLRLHLNPSDIDGLDPEALTGWTVIADSALEPGGLLLEGPDGAVRDTPADWRRAIAAAVRP